MTNIFPTDFIEKATPADDDKILLADSADTDKIKYGKFSNFKWETGETWPTWPAGADWEDWEDGNWIVSITLISTVWKVKTYRILFTDATTYDFTVTDWADWTGSGDMIASTYDPTSVEWDAFDMDNMAQGDTKKYVSATDITNLGNLSWTNSWDNATNTQYSWLAASKEDTANKENSTIDTSTTKFPTVNLLKTGLDAKLALSGWTMTGKVVWAGRSEVAKTYAPATGAQTVDLDCAVNNMHVVTGHADWTAITFTVANATDSQPFIVSILQWSVVSTIAAWFATVRWAWGSAPTLTATVWKRDTFWFIRTWANTYDWFIIWQNC